MALKTGAGRRGLPGTCAVTAAVLSIGGPVAAAALAAATPAKDTFTGRLANATGKLAHDHGDVAVLIHAVRSTGATRQLSLTIEGPTCGRRRHCLRLLGVLKGTISVRPATIPDLGKRYTLLAGGHLDALGRVTATGEVVGVGFIKEGREALTLALRTDLGTVAISARSPEVPGFTTP